MKHIKLFENYNYGDEFNYTTKLNKDEVDIYYKSSDDIEDMYGEATVNWHIEFDHNKHGISSIEVIVDNIELYLTKTIYIRTNYEETDEINETIKIEKNIEIQIQSETILSSISLYPSSLEYDYDKKTATLVLN